MKKSKRRRLYEIKLDGNNQGVSFVSVVRDPAIDVNWLAFAAEDGVVEPKADETRNEFIDRCMSIESDEYPNDQAFAICNAKWEGTQKFEFSSIDEEKRMLAGPFMIPDLKIFRRNEDGEEFDVFFSEETIELAIKKFFRAQSTINLNEEHTNKLVPGYIVESWIVAEGEDKSRQLGFSLPAGTWFGVVHIEDETYWNEMIKSGSVRGFSVEGVMGMQSTKQKFETYTDYPKAASENAQRAIDWADENGWGSCGTPVGKARARQLANGEAISEETIQRMANFIRHQGNQLPYDEGCGKLMWDAWGGSEGVDWAIRKMEQIKKEKENMSKEKFEKIELLDGTEVYTKGDVDFKVGSEVYIMVDETEQPAPDGTHETETITIEVVDGKIATITQKEVAVEEVEEAMAVTAEEQTAIVAEVMQILDPRFEELMLTLTDLMTRVSSLEAELSKAKTENEEMKDEMASFSRSFSPKRIKKTELTVVDSKFNKPTSDALRAFEMAKAFKL